MLLKYRPDLSIKDEIVHSRILYVLSRVDLMLFIKSLSMLLFQICILFCFRRDIYYLLCNSKKMHKIINALIYIYILQKFWIF